MCWIGRKDTKQVAKRDFYVYKVGLVMGNTFISLYQKYIYRIKRNNPIIPLKPVEDNCGMIKIEDGYHSYKEVVSNRLIYTGEFKHINKNEDFNIKELWKEK